MMPLAIPSNASACLGLILSSSRMRRMNELSLFALRAAERVRDETADIFKGLDEHRIGLLKTNRS